MISTSLVCHMFIPFEYGENQSPLLTGCRKLFNGEGRKGVNKRTGKKQMPHVKITVDNFYRNIFRNPVMPWNTFLSKITVFGSNSFDFLLRWIFSNGHISANIQQMCMTDYRDFGTIFHALSEYEEQNESSRVLRWRHIIIL